MRVWDSEGEIVEGLPVKREGIPFKAWVTIMYGCNNFCSYCVVPLVRGRERSREAGVDLEEIKGAGGTGGLKEVTLLGQNVNSYGNDLPDQDWNFGRFLGEVARDTGISRIRFSTSHPKDLSEELIESDGLVIPQIICRHLHLPVQSGSSRVLGID